MPRIYSARKKGDWKPPKVMKGCIRKVLDLCRRIGKVQDEIAYMRH